MISEKQLARESGVGYSKCRNCTGKCCRYILVDIPTPRSRLDFNNYGWYLAHEKTAIYIDGGKWYLAVFNNCRYLNEKNQCAIYENRYQACIDHSEANCEFDGDKVADVIFHDPEELMQYAKDKFRKIARKRRITLKRKLGDSGGKLNSRRFDT